MIGIHGGETLIELYNGEFAQALKATYPEYPWEDSKFRKKRKAHKPHKPHAQSEHPKPPNFWYDMNNQRAYFDKVARDNNIKTIGDWYSCYRTGKISKSLRSISGYGMLQQYKGSISKALVKVYPELNWDPSKFLKSRNYWLDLNNHQAFLEKLAKKLNITNLTDWYKATTNDVLANGGAPLLNYYQGSLTKALAAIYPDIPWKHYTYHRPHQGRVSKGQLSVQGFVDQLLPSYFKEINFRHKDIPHRLELDVYIPDLCLAFEYQGEPHYLTSVYGSHKHKQENDERKAGITKDMGITLITIPFWWDKTISFIANTIRDVRPDISLSVVRTPTNYDVNRMKLLQYTPPKGYKPMKPTLININARDELPVKDQA